jgi:hypothetical protein
VEISSKTFKLVVDVVQACQNAGLLPNASADLMAVSVWGQVHGIVSLAIEGQVSHRVLDKHSIQDIVSFSIERLISS